VKLKLDPALDAFTLSRPLALGVQYPFDWGFVPSTRAPDGDPVDVLVLHDASTYPGVVIACEPIGVVRCSQRRPDGSGRERNDRVIAVPEAAPRQEGVRDARDLPERTRQEIEQFFQIAILLTGKETSFEGWEGRESAERLVEEGIRASRRAGGEAA
jgi:inorganic pyrophosphatase